MKCLNSHQMPGQECREEERPMVRHACYARACNEGNIIINTCVFIINTACCFHVVSGVDHSTGEVQDTPSINTRKNDTEVPSTEDSADDETHSMADHNSNKIHSQSSSSTTKTEDESAAAPESSSGKLNLLHSIYFNI